MDAIFRASLYELEEKLNQISYDYDNTIDRLNYSINEVLSSLDKLKSYILEHSFKTMQNEIDFFKNVKPKFTSKLIYFKKVKKLEVETPDGTTQNIHDYYLEELQKLHYDFTRYSDIRNYYRLGNKFLDHELFVRNYNNVCPNVNPVYHEMDHRFSTSHDYDIATILANKQFKIYVENKISDLGKMTPVFSKPVTEDFCLEWSGEIVDAVEMVYGMHEKQTFNKGNATLADIAKWVTMGTNLKLKDLYGAYGEIKKRKSNVPRYINSLSKSLDERVERDNKKKK